MRTIVVFDSTSSLGTIDYLATGLLDHWLYCWLMTDDSKAWQDETLARLGYELLQESMSAYRATE